MGDDACDVGCVGTVCRRHDTCVLCGLAEAGLEPLGGEKRIELGPTCQGYVGIVVGFLSAFVMKTFCFVTGIVALFFAENVLDETWEDELGERDVVSSSTAMSFFCKAAVFWLELLAALRSTDNTKVIYPGPCSGAVSL